jgi:hypothetical protein
LHLHKYYTFHLCNPFVSCDFIANICKIWKKIFVSWNMIYIPS